MPQSPASPTEPTSVDDALAAARAALAWLQSRVSSPDDDATAAQVADQIVQLQHLIDSAHASQLQRIADHAASRVAPERFTLDESAQQPLSPARAARGLRGDLVRRELDDRHDTAASDLQALLQWGPRTAARRCRLAISAVDHLPELVDELAQGRIDRDRLEAVADALVDVPVEHVTAVAAEVQARVLHGPRGGIRAWTPAMTRRQTAATLARIDVSVVARGQRRKVADALGVWFEPGQVRGTSLLTAVLRTEDAVPLKQAVEQVAWNYRTIAGRESPSADLRPEGADTSTGERARLIEAPAATLGECRVQALVDLIAARAQVSTTATVLIPVRPPVEHVDAELAQRVVEAFEPAEREAAEHRTAHHARSQRADPVAGGHGLDRTDERPWSRSGGPAQARPMAQLGLVVPSGDGWTPAERRAIDAWALDGYRDVDPPPRRGEAPTAPGPQREPAPRRSPTSSSPALPPPTPPPTSSPPPQDTDWSLLAEAADAVSALAQQCFIRSDRLPIGSPASPAAAERACDDVTIDGVGVVPAEVVGRLLAGLGPAVGRALLDERIGTVREKSDPGYRPRASTRRFVELRDGTCRFPSCHRPATFTDADHVVPHAAGGPTSPANLMSLCRTHHRAKHSGAWQVRLRDDATAVWTHFSGQQRETWPDHEPIPF